MSGGSRARQAAATRSRLVEAGRQLFAQQGYAGTGTEQVLAQAGVARGALYHHFADKAALFAAVCDQMQAEAAAAITQSVTAADIAGASAFDQLVIGCHAWLDQMAAPEFRRILIIEAPPVLGWERWNDLDRRHGYGLLREGIIAAQAAGSLPAIPPDDLAILLNGAMNYAVMLGRDPDPSAQITRSKRALQVMLSALRAQAATLPSEPAPDDTSDRDPSGVA